MNKALKITSITLNTILIVITALIVALVGYIAVERYAYDNYMPRVFGYSMAEVGSGSMEPTINTGDLIITKKSKEYEVGDIITFYDPDPSFDGYTTHRIIEIDSDGNYITQGDREGQIIDDYPVTYEDVVGKVVRIIDNGGNTLDFITSPVGIIVIVGSIVIIFLIVDISLALAKNHQQEKKEKENQDKGDT